MVRLLIFHAEEEKAQKGLLALYAESKLESNVQQQLTVYSFLDAQELWVYTA